MPLHLVGVQLFDCQSSLKEQIYSGSLVDTLVDISCTTGLGAVE